MTLTRRSTLGLLTAAAATPLLPRTAFADAAYNFVRIEGLAEQAVGEALLTEVYNRAGMDITVTAMPGRRALIEASNGNMDGETLRVFALGENVSSLKRVPTPLSSLQTVAFARSDAGVSLGSALDIGQFSSVIVSGVLHTEAITEGVSGVRVVDDNQAMFQMVERGRADIALTSYLDGLASLRTLGISDIANVEPALNDQPLYHYVHESKADVIPQIDDIIAGLSASGELAEMRTALETDYLARL